jgi:hypothetical protein
MSLKKHMPETNHKDPFETLFAKTTAGFFLREFCASTTTFKPFQKSEVELADFVIQFAELLMIFQLKSRTDSTEDPEQERAWFQRKVIKKGTRQIRDTISYLKAGPVVIANDRGRPLTLPANEALPPILKIVVFNGSAALPVECRQQRFYQSAEGGFIHVFEGLDAGFAAPNHST